MSATQASLGASGSNCRSSRFSATGRSWLESVVQRNFRAVLAAMPLCCITRATVFTQHPWPRATSSAWTRAAVAGLELGVDGADLHEQAVASLLRGAAGAVAPGVVAGGRDVQRVAQDAHGPLVPVLFDEAVDHSASWAKSAVA